MTRMTQLAAAAALSGAGLLAGTGAAQAVEIGTTTGSATELGALGGLLNDVGVTATDLLTGVGSALDNVLGT